LVFKSPISPLGHLRFSIEVAQKVDREGVIFEALRKAFGSGEFDNLLRTLNPVYVFRNKFVAHQEKEESIGKDIAKTQLTNWISTLVLLHQLRLSG
jgi:hypothetical protein